MTENENKEIQATDYTATDSAEGTDGNKQQPEVVQSNEDTSQPVGKKDYMRGYQAGKRGLAFKQGQGTEYERGYEKGKLKFNDSDTTTEEKSVSGNNETDKPATTGNPEDGGWSNQGPGVPGEDNNDEQQHYQQPHNKITISGNMFLMGLDYIFPKVVKYVFGFFNEKFKRLNSKGAAMLKTTAEERAELADMADEVARILFDEMHPIVGFSIFYSIVQLTKLDMLTDECFDAK